MSMDEKDLKKLAEEQSENIKIPDSLQPDQRSEEHTSELQSPWN